MTTCPYSYAQNNGIEVKYYDFEEFSGICGKFGEKSLIGIKKGYDEITEREILAHELGHFLSGTENNIHFSKYDEQAADVCAREFLIPKTELISLIEDNEGIADACLLAAHFGVSIETMQKRICEVFDLVRNF